MKYCVYLTIYRGNKLPPFYIGSSSVKKIEAGYRGTVASIDYGRIFYEELDNSPHLFETKIIALCNTRHEAYEEEAKLQTLRKVVSSPFYMNKSIAKSVCGELNPFYGQKHSDATKIKMKEKAKNRPGNRLGKKSRPESIEKMRNTKIGKPSLLKGKKYSKESLAKRKKRKPTNKPAWNKGLKGVTVAWNKGLTKEDPRMAYCTRKKEI